MARANSATVPDALTIASFGSSTVFSLVHLLPGPLHRDWCYPSWPYLGAQTKYLGSHYCCINASLALPKTKGPFSAITAKKQTAPWALLLSRNKAETKAKLPQDTPLLRSPNPVPPFSPPHRPPGPSSCKLKKKATRQIGFRRSQEKLIFRPRLYTLEKLCKVYMEQPPREEEPSSHGRQALRKLQKSLKRHMGWQQAEWEEQVAEH